MAASSIERIVSGGQTGVDRAALDVALALVVPCGGWCPHGRRAEDGPIPDRYPLQETPSRKYAQRTRWNVRDSDGTLIITAGAPTGGTALTQQYAQRLNRPCFVVDLSVSGAVVPVARWVERHRLRVLNVAGPRESTQSGIHARAGKYLRRLMPRIAGSGVKAAASAKRTGARKREEIPADVLRQLNRGELETANLVEALAVDFRLLLGHVAPQVPCPDELNASGKHGITRRIESAGAALYAAEGLNAVSQYGAHASDTVRGWVAYVIGRAPDLSLSRRLRLMEPLADDPHFGVREWAWLALRPHVAVDVPAALKSLKKWTTRRSDNLRRFAIEITRPRGVWCKHLDELKKNPAPALVLLEAVRSDSSKYVQDSVGNWLNDASKSRPDWVRSVTSRWLNESDTAETGRIVRRGTRSLPK